jgi:hypothetical protein
MNLKISTIYQCEQLIRAIANFEAGRITDGIFLDGIQKRLKFDDPEGWIALCSIMDALGDTEMAKLSFLERPKSLNIGEGYLRLYGVLNAGYIQLQCLIDLMRLTKLPEMRSFKSTLEESTLILIRHKVGAHSINYLDSITKTKNPHQHARSEVVNGIINISDKKNNFTYYNLKTSSSILIKQHQILWSKSRRNSS